MVRLRFRGSVSITLVVALAFMQSAIAQNTLVPSRSLSSSTPDSPERSYKIYSLDDFGSDPGLCEWIAQTIPDVIAAGTWKGPGTIRYYAPKNILVVCHTPKVQAQVDGFLKDVKKSLPEPTKATAAAPRNLTSGSEVVPIVYRKSESPKKDQGKRTPEQKLSYPVPAQPKTPKHLFHFIIRYEGEGIVDDNIVKAMKDYYRAEKQANPTGGPSGTGSSVAPSVSTPPPLPAYSEGEKGDLKENKNTEKDKQNPCPPVTR